MRALDALEGDARFRAGPRGRRFLRYVVEEELAGRGDRIKAFAVAVDVLGRPVDFNSKDDPIVRTEATRLRQSLEDYYALAGTDLPVRFVLPRGSYRPRFEMTVEPDERVPPPAPATMTLTKRQWRPVAIGAVLVAVLTFGMAAFVAVNAFASRQVHQQAYPIIVMTSSATQAQTDKEKQVSQGITHALVVKLSDFSGIRVIDVPKDLDTGQVLSALRSQDNETIYLFSSQVRPNGDDWRFEWTLTDAANGSVVAADAVDLTATTAEGARPEDEISTDVSRRLADLHGVIELHQQQKTIGVKNDRPCVIRAYNFYALIKYDEPAEIAQCLEGVVATSSEDADAWALLAYMNVATVRHMKVDGEAADKALARAMEASQRAIEIAPDSSQAHLMRAVTLFQVGHLDGFVAEATLAQKLNPASVQPLFVAGNRLYQMGRYKEGLALLDKAYKINPTFPNVNKIMFLIELYRTGEYAEAIKRDAEGEWDKRQYSAPMFMTALYGQTGETEKAKAELANLRTLWPDVGANIRAWLKINHFTEEISEKLIDGLVKAGLEVT